MKGKFIVFFSVISVLLMVSVPCVSAIEYDAIQFNQEKNSHDILKKIKESSTIFGCKWTRMLFIIEVLYAAGIITAITKLQDKPVMYGVSRVIMWFIFYNCFYQIGKDAGYDGEPFWCTPEGWAQLSQEEKKIRTLNILWNVILYNIRLMFFKKIIGR